MNTVADAPVDAQHFIVNHRTDRKKLKNVVDAFPDSVSILDHLFSAARRLTPAIPVSSIFQCTLLSLLFPLMGLESSFTKYVHYLDCESTPNLF